MINVKNYQNFFSFFRNFTENRRKPVFWK